MIFHIVTLFPKVVEPYLNESILRRARRKRLVKIKIYDLRKFAKGRHKQVDDKAYGGGPGMVIKPEPVFRACRKIPDFNKAGTRRLMLAASVLMLVVTPVLYDLLARFTKPRGAFERLINRELSKPATQAANG